MIHWSHFAGSLWDSILAAHVIADTVVDRVATFDAAISDYFQNTFAGSEWEVHPLRLCQYARMSFDNLRLMARRATALPLQLDAATTLTCSKEAVRIIAHAHAYDTDKTTPYILRHQIITTLAGSLLMLCDLLLHIPSSFGFEKHEWVPMCHQEFDAAVDLLHMLAKDTPLAQRVLSDFDKIIPVVQAAISRWAEESSHPQNTPDWGIMNDAIPPNVSELLPYRQQIPDIRLPQLRRGMWATDAAYLETDPGFSPWDEALEPGGARCNVLWV